MPQFPRIRPAIVCSAFLSVLCGWCLAPTAFGQSASGAISTFLDPSISSSGLGHAGAALFWEEDRNDWSNPALLGYEQGIRYSHARIQLVPDLAPDVFYTANRVAFGAYGVGVSLAGKPFKSLGGYHLDYGVSEATDVDGNVIGTFRSTEDVRQVAIGISLLRFYDSLRQSSGHDPSQVSRYVDLSIGHAWKTALVDIAPLSGVLNVPARGEVNERDRGALLRVTPIGARHGEATSRELGVKLDTAFGFSQRNYGDDRLFLLGSVGDSDPVTEERLTAVAGRLSLFLPVTKSAVWDFLTPAITFGGTWEQARYYDNGTRYGEAIDRSGEEIDFLGLVTLRHGFVDDPNGDIHNDTRGFGVHLQYRGIVGARYDWAEVPQSRFLDQRVERRGFTIFFDPIQLMRVTQSDGELALR